MGSFLSPLSPPPPPPPPPPLPTGPTPEEMERDAQKEREKNLLRRARGALGNVRTSFRGILTPADNGNQRKNLLGE